MGERNNFFFEPREEEPGPSPAPAPPTNLPAPRAASGPPTAADLEAQARSQFRLGEFDLMDQTTNSAAHDLFSRFINASGGDAQGLQSEIGDVRFGDRMREWFGKGDTLNQSGRIQIGNGVTIDSLRDLADFNNPSAGPGAGGGGGRGGGTGGPGFIGPPLGGGGGRGGGGGGGGRGDTAFLGFLEGMLRDRIGGGFGIDQETQDAQRSALNATANRQMQSGLHQLTAQLNAAGALGGGRNIVMGQELAQGINESLLNQLAAQQMGFNQMSMQDRQAAFGEGGNFANTLVNQQLGLGDIGVRRQGIQSNERLGFAGLDLQRMLGMGDLDLRGQALGQAGSQFDRSFGLQQNNQMFNQGLQSFLTNAGLLGLS